MKRRQRKPIQLKQSDVSGLREKLLHLQGGICPICEKAIDSPCLDHHHIKRIKGSGQIRGVLCRTCNVFIAKSENNCVRYGIGSEHLPRILRNTADYLEAPQHSYIHPSEAPKPKQLKKSSYNALSKIVLASGRKIPPYPRSKKITAPLQLLFVQYDIEPEFYK